MKKSAKRNAILVVVVLSLLACILLFIVWWNTPLYFENFKSTEDVKQHILSKIAVGSSLEDIQATVNNNSFGYLDCWLSSSYEGHTPDYVCRALQKKGSFFWYWIVFDLENNSLITIEVTEGGSSF